MMLVERNVVFVWMGMGKIRRSLPIGGRRRDRDKDQRKREREKARKRGRERVTEIYLRTNNWGFKKATLTFQSCLLLRRNCGEFLVG